MSMSRPKVRLFVVDALDEGEAINVSAAQAHYLQRVMRLSTGDGVALFNGRDGEWIARISAIGKGRCSVVVEGLHRNQRNEPDLWLAFAPVKKARLDFMVEKATELGVSRLWPVFTRHTVAGRVNLERMRANAMEAAEQCERLSVPEICEAVTLDRLIDAWPVERHLLVMDETGSGRPISEALGVFHRPLPGEFAGCGILVGPEGGFAPSELDALRKLSFVTLVGLGPRILRADTAALSALVCWQASMGDWGDAPPRETNHCNQQ